MADRTKLDELIERARQHVKTPEEIEAQRQSWVRAMTTGCHHGVLDFETCPHCAEERALIAQEETPNG